MGQLGIVVPFSVFTEYRDRRLGGGKIAVANPDAAAVSPAPVPAQDGVAAEPAGLPSRPGEAAEAGESGCVDTTFTSAETIVPAEPTPERIPS